MICDKEMTDEESFVSFYIRNVMTDGQRNPKGRATKRAFYIFMISTRTKHVCYLYFDNLIRFDFTSLLCFYIFTLLETNLNISIQNVLISLGP